MATAPDPTPSTPAVVRGVAELRAEIGRLRARGRRIALVPTMGALHEGHLSLLRRAGTDGAAVVMSLFVNPRQFGPSEDLAAYPRDEARDVRLAGAEGADLVWAPAVEDIYPEGYATRVSVGGPAEGLEGDARPDHFEGVATVVAKLVLAVRPDLVVFGQKDAQQVAVIRRLMADLHLDDIELVVAPIVREPDGLALSSRNAYLGPEDRAAAIVLRRALAAGEALVAEGETDPARVEAAAAAVLAAEPRCRPEYAAVVDPDGFRRPERLDAPALLCVAARLGTARLIDNVILPVPHNPARRAAVRPKTRTMLKSKIHRATVTDADLNYTGSITVDAELLRAADIRPYEQVAVVNVNTGARFETYAIEGAAASGTMCLNGAAARLAHPGDLIIVFSYAAYDEDELEGHEPIAVHVDERNRPTTALVRDTLPESWEPER
jgi:pantoate--beta-alanine ligase